MDQTLVELSQKIDALTSQVAYLTEQARVAERQREDRAELMRDLTPIADQAFHMSIQQLEEIQGNVDLSDLLRLLKRFLRNGRNFEKMLDQLESVMDLFQTVGPLSDEAFKKAIVTLAGMEQKGYFAFARAGMRLVDNIVTSFSEEDINHLGENIVLILNTIKDMTQPEIMHFVRNTLLIAEREVEKPVDVSYIALLRQMGDPEVRRGLALTMRMLHAVGAQAS